MSKRDSKLQGDRPLDEKGVDRLGFETLASELAGALASRAATSGMVIGLEGKWGSGKSSLIHLISAHMAKLEEQSRPYVLHFKPWLIGSRDALITAFFDDLSKMINQIKLQGGDATGVTIEKTKRISEELRRYAGYVGMLAPAASLASILSVPGGELANQLLKGMKRFSKNKDSDKPTLDSLKNHIEGALASLPNPIIVFVDDVDRLDPDEIVELLRLVRSVADFPNVTYVLCYDTEIVSQAISTALKVNSGPAYLEKIFQMTVRVPEPEPFALRKMFEQDLSQIIDITDELQLARVSSIIDLQGGRYLATPRMVNRTLDAIRFIYPILNLKVDFADCLWITLVRLNNSALYQWIEQYLGSMSAISTGRVTVTSESAEQSYAELKSILEFVDDKDFLRKMRELGQLYT